MRKIFFGVMIIFLFLPLISAIDLSIQDMSSNEALIVGLDQPAMFNLKITNNGAGDNFQFFNFFGTDTLPKGTVQINGMETKNVQVGIYPRSDLRQLGRIQFDIYIKSQTGQQMTYPLMVNVIPLQEAFEVGAQDFKPDSGNVTIYIKNLVYFNFNNLYANFKSPFFTFDNSFSLGPLEKKTFEVTLDKEQFRDLMAGFYTLNVGVQAGNQKASVQGTMKFIEKNIVTSTQNQYGVIVNTYKITKSNDGNVVSATQTVLKKNVLSRLFTSFSPDPDSVERKGLIVYYTWARELKPGEQLNITVTTNWLLPLLAVLLIIAIVILTKQFSRTNLVLKKRVTFVKAKGGEFALKVSVIVTAKKFIERVNVIDRLPHITKLHERFGGETPKKIDMKLRRIEWYFDRMQEGESRVISYIIYSRVGVLGRFALPTATAIFEKDGEVHEAESNQAFFMAEQARKPIDD